MPACSATDSESNQVPPIRQQADLLPLAAAGQGRPLLLHDPPLPEGFDPGASRGLGMKIVQALVEQIGGDFRIDRCEHCGGPRMAVAFA